MYKETIIENKMTEIMEEEDKLMNSQTYSEEEHTISSQEDSSHPSGSGQSYWENSRELSKSDQSVVM